VAGEVCIVTFPTTHAALSAEQAAANAGFNVWMIPVPRSLSADCNMGMEASLHDMEPLRVLLSSRGIDCNLVRSKK